MLLSPSPHTANSNLVDMPLMLPDVGQGIWGEGLLPNALHTAFRCLEPDRLTIETAVP